MTDSHKNINITQNIDMVRRSQRHTSTINTENNLLDPIDLDSASDIEILDVDTNIHENPRPSSRKRSDKPKDIALKKKKGSESPKKPAPTSPLESREKAKNSVKLPDLTPSKKAGNGHVLNPSNKVNSSKKENTKSSQEETPADEFDSDEEISVLEVVEVPSQNKFLRKRAKKHEHVKDSRRKPSDRRKESLSDGESTKVPVEPEAQSAGVSSLKPVAPTTSERPVIEIDSGSEDEVVLAPVSKPASSAKRSAIHILYNSSNSLIDDLDDSVNLDTVTIHELVGTADLLETFQFNFSIDLEYFLTYLHPDFSKNKRNITFISGNSHLAGHPLRKEIENKFNISELIAPLPNRFASHHSKMMINFYLGDQVEVVIMTCNLTQLDFGGLTQAVWRSGKLHMGETTAIRGKRFKRDLTSYLKKYGMPKIDKLIERLGKFNFNPVEVELVVSAPGIYSFDKIGAKDETYGYGKLRQVLHRNDLLVKNSKKMHNVLAQVTSIAYPYASKKGETASVFTHLLCPSMFTSWKKQLAPGSVPSQEHQKEFNYEPHIIFPTAKEVAASNFGYLSGSAVHFNFSGTLTHQNQYTQNVKPYLRKWGSSSKSTGRESVTPHVKYYACDNGDNWRTLKWVLVGSHNLSKQAWGYPQTRTHGQTFEVSSYELSVLVIGNKKGLIPVYGLDFSSDPNATPVRLPFGLPPSKYAIDDKPWSAGENHGQMKDRWGNFHHGGYSD